MLGKVGEVRVGRRWPAGWPRKKWSEWRSMWCRVDRYGGQSSPVQPHPRWENMRNMRMMMMMMNAFLKKQKHL